jgi:lipopolysaccharide export system permease protein
MRLLDRYLLRELLIPLGYCLSGFLIFWLTADLISNLDAYREDRMRWLDLLEYYGFKLPEFLVVVMPVALLLALLYALTNHARHQELTAMRAAGMSLWRICAPYLAMGFGLSAVVYLLNEEWLEESVEHAERVRNRRTTKAGDESARAWETNVNFRNDRASRVWRIRAYNVDTAEMRDPWVEWSLPDGTRCQLLAEQGIRTNRIWRFFNVRLFITERPDRPDPEQRQLPFLVMPEFTETPAQIRSQIKISQLSSLKAARQVRLTVAEILRYQQLHPQLRREDRAMLQTQLHARLAAPWTCLVVVLIAIPFGAPSGRRNVFVGVASSIFVCLLYYLCHRIALLMGTKDWWHPLLAGWLPNAVFGLAGILLTFRVR